MKQLEKFLKLRKQRLIQIMNEGGSGKKKEETCRARIFEIERILGFLDSSKEAKARDIKDLESNI